MMIFVYSAFIYIISMYIVGLYMAVNERFVTVRRLAIMALPVINEFKEITK